MDIQILLFFQNFREQTCEVFSDFFKLITTFAAGHYIFLPALFIFWVIDKKKGRNILLSLGMARLFNVLFKSIFCIYRPWIKSSELRPMQEVMNTTTGYSFPSGHNTFVGAFYGSLIFCVKKNKKLITIFIIMILLTMMSRLYVGVHTPQDVIIGALLGFFCAFSILKINKYLEKEPEKDLLVFGIGTIFCIIVLLFITFKSYPIDFVDGKIIVNPNKIIVESFIDPGNFFGVLLGWIVEKNYINFKIVKDVHEKIRISFIGALLVILSYSVFDRIGKMININIVYFIFNALIPFMFMTVFPLIFIKENKTKRKNKK